MAEAYFFLKKRKKKRKSESLKRIFGNCKKYSQKREVKQEMAQHAKEKKQKEFTLPIEIQEA
jgi:hypothetical protein